MFLKGDKVDISVLVNKLKEELSHSEWELLHYVEYVKINQLWQRLREFNDEAKSIIDEINKEIDS
jgi:hypothetical protein